VYDGTHPDTGKMRYATRTVRGSRREALAELEVFAAQVAKPRRQALDTTLVELFEQWYATAAPGWAVNTQRQTLSVIKVHLVPRFGDLPVGQLTTANIDAFYAELRRRGGSDGRGLSDGTVHRIHGVLRQSDRRFSGTSTSTNMSPDRAVLRTDGFEDDVVVRRCLGGRGRRGLWARARRSSRRRGAAHPGDPRQLLVKATTRRTEIVTGPAEGLGT